jgi:hypothetical protein
MEGECRPQLKIGIHGEPAIIVCRLSLNPATLQPPSVSAEKGLRD